MSERGTYAIDRGLWEHPRFAPEPFTEREAWAWMLGQAAYRPHCRRVGKYRVTLQRGQFAASLRFMAKRWQWSEASVRRFIVGLASAIGDDDAMVTQQNDAGISVITILNYDAFQDKPILNDAANLAENDALMTHSRRKEESNDKVVVVGGAARASAISADIPTEDDYDLARSFLVSIKRDPDDPGWLGATGYQAVVWRKRGYARETILADAAVIETKGNLPPSYYFTAIERRHAVRAAQAIANSSAPTPLVQPGATHEKARDNSLKGALGRLRETEERLRASASAESSEDAPRLLSNR